METMKTAVVVALLLAVLYGVYTVLNKPEPTPPSEVADWNDQDLGEIAPPLDIDLGVGDPSSFGGPGDLPTPAPGGPGLDTAPPTSVTPLPTDPGISLPAADPGPPNFSAPDVTPDLAVNDPPSYPQTGAPNYSQYSDPVTPSPSPDATDPGLADPGGTAPGSTAPGLAGPGGAAPGGTAPGGIASSGPDALSPYPGGTAPGNTPPIDPVGLPDTTPSASPDVPDNGTSGLPLYGMPAGDPPAADTSAAPGVAPPTQPAVSPVDPSPPAQSDTLTTPPATDASPPQREFDKARQSALAQIQAGNLKNALFTLSLYYDDPGLTPEEHRQLLDLLDPLAGRVIYSRQHLMTDAHVVEQYEKLDQIADSYQVPIELLMNINGIQRPQAVAGGTELKVVQGPFRAEVDLTRGELTLFLGRLYAGRFPISVGNDPSPREGEFTVKEKRPGQTYYSPSGSLPANDDQNPYGKHWIDLGDLSIHGSPFSPSNLSAGCISLAPSDAADVYGILSVGSQVTVKR